MALDINKNQPGDYRTYLIENVYQLDNQLYTNGSAGDPTTILRPGDGLGVGFAHPRVLAKNDTDIESFLRGIRANDLVNGPFIPTPELNVIPSLNIIKKTSPIMPENLIVSRTQRPMFLN